MNWNSIIPMLGPAGIALVILSCFSLYFALRNGIFLFLVMRDFKKKFNPGCTGAVEYTRQVCGKTNNPLTGIIADIVTTHATHSKDIRAEVAYLFHRNFESVTRGLTYLRLISVISPLLGLLGTMFGMVEVFQNVASRTAADTAMLASGIWEALLTTILGLCIAIPTLVFYYYLTLTLKGCRIEAIEHSYRAIELLGLSCPCAADSAGERTAEDLDEDPAAGRLA